MSSHCVSNGIEGRQPQVCVVTASVRSACGRGLGMSIRRERRIDSVGGEPRRLSFRVPSGAKSVSAIAYGQWVPAHSRPHVPEWVGHVLTCSCSVDRFWRADLQMLRLARPLAQLVRGARGLVIGVARHDPAGCRRGVRRQRRDLVGCARLT